MKLPEVKARNIIKDKGFYDRKQNPNGKGITNQYRQENTGQHIVVIDNATGLMWQRSGSEYITYQEAREYIEKLNRDEYAGYTNWRMPSLLEAMTLVEPISKGNNSYIDPIFDTNIKWIWTSNYVSISRTWAINFYLGESDIVEFRKKNYVRAVRSLYSTE